MASLERYIARFAAAEVDALRALLKIGRDPGGERLLSGPSITLTPPLSISASPALTRKVDSSRIVRRRIAADWRLLLSKPARAAPPDRSDWTHPAARE
jgi:hypothetical protein